MPDFPVSIGNHADDGLPQRLAQFSDDLTSSLSKHGAVSLDLSEVRHPDLRVVQVVEAARKQAAVTGATVALVGAVDAGLLSLLERAGFLAGEHPFWSQGTIAR